MRLAALGQRDMDTGSEKIADAGELAQVRKQARKVYVESAATAVVLTALCMLIP